MSYLQRFYALFIGPYLLVANGVIYFNYSEIAFLFALIFTILIIVVRVHMSQWQTD